VALIDRRQDGNAAAPPSPLGLRPDVSVYSALPSNIPVEKNPGTATSMVFDLDGPDSASIQSQEWGFRQRRGSKMTA
jgi:hypothetical protein